VGLRKAADRRSTTRPCAATETHAARTHHRRSPESSSRRSPQPTLQELSPEWSSTSGGKACLGSTQTQHGRAAVLGRGRPMSASQQGGRSMQSLGRTRSGVNARERAEKRGSRGTRRPLFLSDKGPSVECRVSPCAMESQAPNVPLLKHLALASPSFVPLPLPRTSHDAAPQPAEDQSGIVGVMFGDDGALSRMGVPSAHTAENGGHSFNGKLHHLPRRRVTFFQKGLDGVADDFVGTPGCSAPSR